MSKNQSKVLGLYAISLATNQKEILYLQVITCAEYENSLGLNIKNSNSHKIATFLKLWEYNMSFNQ